MNQTISDLGYLLHHLALSLDRQSDLFLQDHLDIGFSQFKILMALQQKQGVQQKEIAAKLGQTEASVSRQVKMLEEAGYLRCTKSKHDKRQHITVLTKKGERVISQALGALNKYHAPVFNRLSPARQMELRDMLEQMHQEACHTNRQPNCQ